MAAGHFAGYFSAIFGFGPVSHSVAGQPSRNPEMHPESSPETKTRKKYTNIGGFRILVSGDLGCILGCVLGLRGFFCAGCRRSQ